MELDENKQYLVIFEDNWADEMDINGFFTCDGAYLIGAKETLLAYDGDLELYIGTNEEISYSSGEEMWNTLRIKEITLAQKEVLTEVFSGVEEMTTEDRFEYYLQCQAMEENQNTCPQPQCSNYNDSAAYTAYRKEYERWNENENTIFERLKAENKDRVAEIVALQKAKEITEQEDNFIISALCVKMADVEEWDAEIEIAKLTPTERQELIAAGQKIDRSTDVSFGFADILDRCLERIAEDDDEDADEEDDE